LQRWYSDAAGPAARDPYRLYAASNAGSLLGLIAYPLVVEPVLGLREQGVAWAAGYAVFAALSALCGWKAWSSNNTPPVRPAPVPVAPPQSGRVRVGGVAPALVPSSLMLSVPAVLSTDVPPVPMLWVAPLSLYLLTFVIAFGRRPEWLRWTAWVPTIAV